MRAITSGITHHERRDRERDDERQRGAERARAGWTAGWPCGGNPIVAGVAAGRPTPGMGSPTTADDVTGPAPAAAIAATARVVIEARGLHKSFRIPEHRIDSLKERATHPFTRVEYREHRALRDVSFDVRRASSSGSSAATARGRAAC